MNLANYYNCEKLDQESKNIKSIFFYRICGTGMGAAACLLKDAGFHVGGADSMFYPPMSTYLENSGIEYQKIEDLDLEELKGKYDLIVVGNVVARGCDEARKIEELGIPFCSFPAAIGSLVLKNKKVIGIAGTHGKTTTTYLGVQIFEKLGVKPGHFIGAVMNDRAPASLGEGEYFFIESDEYDSAYFEKFSKFQSYFIDMLAVTSLEFDHADIFSSIEDIKDEFRNVLPKVKEVFTCDQWSELKNLRKEFISKEWHEYGDSNIKILENSNIGTKFSFTMDKEYIFKTNLVGLHNILNLCSIIQIALTEGFEESVIQTTLGDLKLAQRRQELKGNFQGADIIDDFAHHPTAVKETFDALKVKYPDKDFNIYLEPGSATARSDIFQNEFTQALKGAKTVSILKPTRKTSAIGHKDMDIDKLIKDLNEFTNAQVITEQSELIDQIKANSNENSVQVIMSNSSCFGFWSSDFAKKL